MFPLKDTQLNLLGACFQFGQKHQGVELAPNVIREHGVFDLFKSQLNDFGNVWPSDELTFGQMYFQLYKKT